MRSPGAPETEAGAGVAAGLAALAPDDAPGDAPARANEAPAADDAAAMDQDENDDHVGEWSASTPTGSEWDSAAVPPSAAAPSDDLAPLDDLEPIEDEEPLSFSGRVRAGLQVAAAVVVGVVLAGTVYFLFGADVGVGGGDAVAPRQGRAPAEVPVSDSTSAADSSGLRTAGGGRSPTPRPVSPAPGDETDSDPASREPVGREPAGRGPADEDVRAPASGPAQGPQGPPSAPEVETAPVGGAAGSIRGEEPASPQVGWLLVRTSPPGATVTVEGVDRGPTPLSLRDVPYGVHRVEIHAPGYEPQTREVTVSAEATVAAIRVELAPGSGRQAAAAPPPETAERSPLPVPVATDASVAADASVGSVFVESRPPGARVVIDGEPAGTTPIVVTDLPPGRREVRIERDGYTPWVTVVEVPAFDRLRVAASLDRARP